MKIKLSIDYRTVWGQRLFVCGSVERLGKWEENKAAPMIPAGDGLWTLEVELEEVESASLEYKYFLLDENLNRIEWEFGDNRRLKTDPKRFVSVEVRDFWRSNWDEQNTLYTSPFLRAFFQPDGYQSKNSYKKDKNYLRLQLKVPRVGRGYRIGVLGNNKALGNWQEEKVILMDNPEFPLWQVDVAYEKEDLPIEYKYVMYEVGTQKVVEWEWGENRSIGFATDTNVQQLQIRSDENFRFRSGNWRGCGVAIPVFSLRSEQSLGAGEFPDIKLLADWAAQTGNRLIQVLPVNDTVATHTWVDSYPYAGISVYALHPIYANLNAIGPLKDKKKQKQFDNLRAELNGLDHVAYEKVMEAKSRYFKLAYDEQKEAFLKSREFKTFFDRNKKWLVPYAVFSCLRDRFGTPDFSKWPQFSEYKEAKIRRFADPKESHYDDIAVHYFIQFHLDKQLKEASAYARSRGVVLKGDIPIGIYRFSADAWVAPHLYHMDSQAGAPPDDFSITGQNWGFPTYSWEEMARDGYAWWKDRLSKMADYFDVFRIDHILGFFRIWEIPMHAVEGLLGHFNPSLPFSLDELRNWGLPFDRERFCRPYIRSYMLAEIFGTQADVVRDTYLQEYKQDHYLFLPEFESQRKLKEHFDEFIKHNPSEADHYLWMRTQLFRLQAEVLFLEAPDSAGQSFNPRIGFHNTYSYRDLPQQMKDVLNKLYTHYFYKRHNDFWRSQAMEKLPAIKSATDMLICGEDLGMVPESVPGVMSELQILSLAVQRMPNNPAWEFWNPAHTPYLAVTTTSSHDTSTLRGWWEEDREKTQRFYNHILGLPGEAPLYCEPHIVEKIVSQHLLAPAMWAIFPIQDLLAMDGDLRRVFPSEERINIPAVPQHYWKYRMHLTIEQLMKETAFNGKLRSMTEAAGRNKGY